MKRTFISTRTALLFASVLVLVCCLAVASLVPIAQAYTSSAIESGTGLTKIGEIFNENATTGGTFDRTNLEELVNALLQSSSFATGNKPAKGDNLEQTVLNLRDAVDSTSTSIGSNSMQNYSDAARINDLNIIVEFGGITWYATFLSLADTKLDTSVLPNSYIGNKPTVNEQTVGNGTDLILTLYQALPTAGSENSAKWVGDASGYGNSDADSKTTNTNEFPANMYGASYLRAVTLNNGGVYATGIKTSAQATPNADNTYAKFNMGTYSEGGATKNSNIHDFLVAPRYMNWQKYQLTPSNWSNWGVESVNKALNNEAWGSVGSGNYIDRSICYENYTYYSTWKDDLIWIPSCTEVGNIHKNANNAGIWGLNQEQRSYSDGTISEALWLRTADVFYYDSRGLKTDGTLSDGVTSGVRLVRPALNLNLTAAAKEADSYVDKPIDDTTETVKYNGQKQTLDLGLASELATGASKKVDISFTQNDNDKGVIDYDGGTVSISATEAGTYKVTVTPANGYRWKNDENNDDTEPIEFTLTIEKRKVNLNVAIPQGSPTSVPYGTAYTLLDVDSYWSYASGSLEFVNGDESNLTVSCDAVATGAFPTPDSYPLTVSYVGNKDNYDLTIDGNPTVTVTKADLVLSGNFTTTYEYDLDANGEPVKRELKIAESQVTAVNGQKVSFVYGALTATTTGYDASTDGFAVWKVGTYYVDVTITAPNHNTLTQRISVTITKAKPTVTPLCDRSELWTSGVLPELTCTATLRNNQPVVGAISWITSLGTVRSDGYYDFYYRWVPEDQENFEIVDGDDCYVRLYVRFASVTRFTVTFDPESELFYETDSLNILKNYLTVTVTFSDGTTRVLGMNEYDLNCQGGTTLVAGDSVTVTVSYLSAGTPVERNFNVQVLAVERPVDPDPTPQDPTPQDPNPGKDTINKAKEFFESTPLPLGYATLVLGGLLLIIIILAIAGRKPKKKD